VAGAVLFTRGGWVQIDRHRRWQLALLGLGLAIVLVRGVRGVALHPCHHFVHEVEEGRLRHELAGVKRSPKVVRR
jgi:hypothetical protein